MGSNPEDGTRYESITIQFGSSRFLYFYFYVEQLKRKEMLSYYDLLCLEFRCWYLVNPNCDQYWLEGSVLVPSGYLCIAGLCETLTLNGHLPRSEYALVARIQ